MVFRAGTSPRAGANAGAGIEHIEGVEVKCLRVSISTPSVLAHPLRPVLPKRRITGTPGYWVIGLRAKQLFGVKRRPK